MGVGDKDKTLRNKKSCLRGDFFNVKIISTVIIRHFIKFSLGADKT